jgi:hypothetical protein
MFIKLSNLSLEYLVGIVADKEIINQFGDIEYFPLRYLSGSELVKFFNQFGYRDEYGSGFPARKKYAYEKLNDLNNKGRIKEVLENFFSPQSYIDLEVDLIKQLDKLNKYIYYDDLSIRLDKKKCIINSTKKTVILSNALSKVDHDYIKEHINKCDQKIEQMDYSGAINNAKSLLESVLNFIRGEISDKSEEIKENLELPILYKQVSRKLNLSEDEKKSNSINQILRGLSGIVAGLASYRNLESDAHGKGNKKKSQLEFHHAILAANSAKTISEFIYSSYEKQYLSKQK